MKRAKRFQIAFVSWLFTLLILVGFLPVTTIAQSPTLPQNTPTPGLRTFTAPPTLTAQAAFAIDTDTGRILLNKEGSRRLPMASTTKIMTALTVFDIAGVNLEDVTIVVQDDLVGEANMGLYSGERIKIITLLYGALMNSANDACMTLARYAGSKLAGEGDPVQKFVKRMNTFAGRLGLTNSSFENPHGLDQANHYSSAEDLAIAGWYAMQNRTIANIVKLSEVNFNGNYFYNISNFIRRYPGANGVKPGETDNAGLCIVASASRFRRNAIIVLLDSPAMRTESDLLMDYAFSQIMNGTPAPPKPTITATAPLNPTVPSVSTISNISYLAQPIAYIGLPLGGYLLPFKNEATQKVITSDLERYLPELIGRF